MDQRQQLPILAVVQTNASFQRFFIEDEQERVWTGRKFDTDGPPALFATQFAVRSAYHEILKGYFPGVQSVKYIVPLTVEVYSHQPLHISHVAKYLADAASLQMNTPVNGHGPGNSLVLPRIEWHQIDEVKENLNV